MLIKFPIDPFDRQVTALLSETEVTALVSGARGGKTQTGACAATIWALEQPGYLIKDIYADEPYVIMIGAPTFPLLYTVIVPTMLRMLPEELVVGRYNETKKRIIVQGQYGLSYIYFRSGTKVSSWYGMKPYRVWLDEFPVVKEELYDEIQTRLSDTKGRMLLTGTPQGPNWAYHRIYVPWLNGDERINFYTWRTVDNPYIDPEFIESKRKSMPSRYFKRTFEATWDTFEGQIYEEYLPDVHLQPRKNFSFFLPKTGQRMGKGEQHVRLRRVVAGVDWGYGPGHAGVILVLGLDTTGRWFVLEESVSEHLLKTAEPLVDSWTSRARALAIKWEIERFYCDTEDPEAIAQFRRSGIKAQGAVKDVLAGIQAVARYLHIDEDTLEPRLIVLSDCRATSEEFTYYHWQEGKEKPVKINDNCMDALRYGIYTDGLRGKFKHEPAYSA